jgi:hypothetical protein
MLKTGYKFFAYIYAVRKVTAPMKSSRADFA